PSLYQPMPHALSPAVRRYAIEPAARSDLLLAPPAVVSRRLSCVESRRTRRPPLSAHQATRQSLQALHFATSVLWHRPQPGPPAVARSLLPVGLFRSLPSARSHARRRPAPELLRRAPPRQQPRLARVPRSGSGRWLSRFAAARPSAPSPLGSLRRPCEPPLIAPLLVVPVPGSIPLCLSRPR